MAKVKLSAFDRLRLGARLNRKERRDVEQRLSAADPGLEIVNRDAAALMSEMKAITWPYRAGGTRNLCASSGPGPLRWWKWRSGWCAVAYAR